VKVIDLATRSFFLYGGQPECVSIGPSSAAATAAAAAASSPGN